VLCPGKGRQTVRPWVCVSELCAGETQRGVGRGGARTGRSGVEQYVYPGGSVFGWERKEDSGGEAGGADLGVDGASGGEGDGRRVVLLLGGAGWQSKQVQVQEMQVQSRSQQGEGARAKRLPRLGLVRRPLPLLLVTRTTPQSNVSLALLLFLARALNHLISSYSQPFQPYHLPLSALSALSATTCSVIVSHIKTRHRIERQKSRRPRLPLSRLRAVVLQ